LSVPMVSLLFLPQCGQGSSIVAESSALFMGRSFRFGGWGQSLHCIGLDRPALCAVCVQFVHALNARFFWAAKVRNSSQQGCEAT
jgi:hypothetical protein